MSDQEDTYNTDPFMAKYYHETSFEYSKRQDLTDQCPKVSLDQLNKIYRLGSGAFATVYAVRGLPMEAPKRERQVSNRSTCSTEILDSDDEFFEEEEASERQEQLFAVKQLQDTARGENLDRAVADLVTEARVLAQVDHPHIVTLQAVSSGPRFHESFFIVIDYLSISLKKRIEQWKVEEHHFSGLAGKLHDFHGQRRAGLFQERLRAARDLGSAFQYLHANRICYRDLKLENVGFDRDGSIKLFDFGLAKELPAIYHKDDLFNMTPNTGTLKYMAPEVALGMPYNESCDVYSFAIVLWEILSLKSAFSYYTNEELKKSVIRAPYKRPPRSQKWPEELRTMMHKAWSPRIQDRPSAKDMELMLMDLCLEEHKNKRHSSSKVVVHKSHHLHFHKPKFHIFDHKHSGHSHHHHPLSGDTDDCSSSIHEEPLSLSVH